ncbi:ABC transporter substrate-binding protein [Sphingomonas sp.]|uniref:ABC transporter substrate-binding protein n=1 Tax=Sphingomonas sp. TaxID=28214 RepID=UPI002869FB5F|nr:ABC transporter substrate-binding protein [Sphingomonas sp.]
MRRLILIAAVMALGGCKPAGKEALAVIVIGSASDKLQLADPADGPLSAPRQLLMQNVAQGLVRFDARGQIEPGLAERWNVSDDGLSYIFRIGAGKWPDGRTIHARDVARLLTRQLRPASRNSVKDALGAVQEIVAMTDRVIEIRLAAPRPNLLQLLAQPEFALTREGMGTGPFQPQLRTAAKDVMPLLFVERVVGGPDRRELVDLSAAPAARAIAAFGAGKADLVLGGTFADLPLVGRTKIARSTVRFDPVAGLFGLVPTRRSGPLVNPVLRDLLNRSIDRDALIAAFGVPGLTPRATLLQSGLEGLGGPVQPAWIATPLAERRAALAAEAKALVGSGAPISLAIALPDGPGATILFDRLAADWGAIGIALVRAGPDRVADLRLIDAVAPSSSPAWFIRSFRCTIVPLCSTEADKAMDDARAALVADQRAAFISEANRLVEKQTLFLPLAAPIRWSLVGNRVQGFAENIVARHPLTRLGDRLSRDGQ